MATVKPPMMPSPPLERCISAADDEATIACVMGMTPEARIAQRPGLRHLHERLDKAHWQTMFASGGPEQAVAAGPLRAAAVALVLCGTATDAAGARLPEEQLLSIVTTYRVPAGAGLASALLARSPYLLRPALKLVAAGLSARPEGEAYAVGLMTLPRTLGRTRLEELMAADPGLAPSLILVFDFEGTADCCLASIEKYNRHPESSWTAIFLSLIERGVFTRAALLEKTLDALERGWPQHRSGWFSRFHDALNPDLREMRRFADRYLGLCQSRIPPTVSMALDALTRLFAAGHVDGGALLPALAPVMFSTVKAQITKALALIELAVEREPALIGEAGPLAASGLTCSAAPAQKRILRRLAAWGCDDRVRAVLRDCAPGIAAVNRALLRELAGAGDTVEQPPREALPTPDDRPAVSPLDPERALRPIDDLIELVERAAYVLENDTDVDEFERVLEALLRKAPALRSEASRFSPVVKRARRARRPIAIELSRVILAVVSGERIGPKRPHLDQDGRLAHEALARRIDALLDSPAVSIGLTPLSASTHLGGFIDPQVLVERIRAYQAAGIEPPVFDAVSAILRLSPDDSRQARPAARTLRGSAIVNAVRYALGDEISPGPERPLYVAASRIRHPHGDDTRTTDLYGDLGPDGCRAARYRWETKGDDYDYEGRTYVYYTLEVSSTTDTHVASDDYPAILRHPPPGIGKEWSRPWTFCGYDEGSIRYAANLLPSDHEALFADGAKKLGSNLDWGEAQWENRAYLIPLLDPVVQMRPMANLVLALGLAGKDPGQTAISIDVLVQTVLDGRADLPGLAETMRKLLSTRLTLPARYRKSLEAAASADRRMPQAVLELLCGALTMGAESVPKRLSDLLELVQELSVDQGIPVRPETLAAISTFKLGGKGRELQKWFRAQGPQRS